MAGSAVSKAISLLNTLLEDSGQDILQEKGETKLDAILRSKIARFSDTLGPSAHVPHCKDYLTAAYESKVSLSRCVECRVLQAQDSPEKNQLHKFNGTREHFTVLCLGILSELGDDLIGLQSTQKGSAEEAKELAVGVRDQKLISTALQFIISLGICPNLYPGIGVPLVQRTGFNELFEDNKQQVSNEIFLFICLKKLCKLAKDRITGQIILTKHLGDILGALIQIGFKKPNSVDEVIKGLDGMQTYSSCKRSQDVEDLGICCHERNWCREELNSLMNRMYQPIVIRELLTLQGFFRVNQISKSLSSKIPRWFTRICGKLLSERLMQKNGVLFILKTLFDGCSMGKISIIIIHIFKEFSTGMKLEYCNENQIMFN